MHSRGQHDLPILDYTDHVHTLLNLSGFSLRLKPTTPCFPVRRIPHSTLNQQPSTVFTFLKDPLFSLVKGLVMKPSRINQERFTMNRDRPVLCCPSLTRGVLP